MLPHFRIVKGAADRATLKMEVKSTFPHSRKSVIDRLFKQSSCFWTIHGFFPVILDA